MEKIAVLEFVNENPEKYLRARATPEINGQRCIISKDIKGHLVVSCAGEVFEFTWDRQSETWF